LPCRANSLSGPRRQKIAGSRILDDRVSHSSTAVCVPKGKPAALAYVSDFIEEAKTSGLVRNALDEMGLKSSQVCARRHETLSRCVARRRHFWRVDTLRPDAKRYHAARMRRTAALHHLHKKRRIRPLCP